MLLDRSPRCGRRRVCDVMARKCPFEVLCEAGIGQNRFVGGKTPDPHEVGFR
jgi:hypothetical protein